MYSRPALAELVQRVRTDVLSRLSTDDLLRRADAEVYARVLGGVAHGLYGFIDWLSNQVIFDTAEVEFLERWCSIWASAVRWRPLPPAALHSRFRLAHSFPLARCCKR